MITLVCIMLFGRFPHEVMPMPLFAFLIGIEFYIFFVSKRDKK